LSLTKHPQVIQAEGLLQRYDGVDRSEKPILGKILLLCKIQD